MRQNRVFLIASIALNTIALVCVFYAYSNITKYKKVSRVNNVEREQLAYEIGYNEAMSIYQDYHLHKTEISLTQTTLANQCMIGANNTDFTLSKRLVIANMAIKFLTQAIEPFAETPPQHYAGSYLSLLNQKETEEALKVTGRGLVDSLSTDEPR